MILLNNIINELEAQIIFNDKRNNAVSLSTVGWQIEHTLLVICQIINTLEKSNPTDYKWKFNFLKMLILFTKKIPRGKAKAPKQVVPEGDITTDSLKNNIEKTQYMITKLNNLHPNQFFKHPYFGDLNLKPTIKFLVIHTNHHLNIIKDIVK